MLTGFSALSTLLSAPGAAARKRTSASQPAGIADHSYPGKRRTLDFVYYRDKHLGMMRDLYGSSLGRMEVRNGLRKGDGSAPAFVTSVTVEILSMKGFEAAGKLHFQKLMADLPNFSNITPVGQIEEIL
jgi:uncharacterized protein (TIGR02118 family)